MPRCVHVVAALLTAILIVGGSPVARAVDAGPARNRAAALLDNGEDAKAIEAFKDLVKRFPDSIPDRVNLGIALINHNDLDGAEAELRTALAKDPADLRAHYNLGLVLKKRGKNEEAAKEMAVVAASPEGQKDATVWYQLGLLQKRLRRSDEALASFRKAVALRPEHGSAHFQLYNELIQRGEKQAAQPELEEFKVLQKATPEFQRNEAYLERGTFTRIAGTAGEGPALDAKPQAAAGPIRFEVVGAAVGTAGATKKMSERASGAPGGGKPSDSAGPAGERSRIDAAAALADFDGDGALDIGAASVEGPVRLYRRQASGDFGRVLATLEPPMGEGSSGRAYTSRARALAAADVDNDGDVDLLVTSGKGVRLYLNQGQGRFTDGTKDAGLADVRGAASAVWFDADRDGDLDLVLGRQPENFPVPPPLRDGEIELTEEAEGRAQGTGDSSRTVSANQGSRLYLNAGLFPDVPGSSTPAGSAARTSASKARFAPAGTAAAFLVLDAIAAADLRGSDDLDLVFVEATGSRPAFGIARNLRGGRFRGEPAPPYPGNDIKPFGISRFGVEISTVDLDEDGRPDLLVKDPEGVLVYWTDVAGGFPVPPQSLIAASSDAGNPRGGPDIPSTAVLDADGDGRPDVAVLLVDPVREGGNRGDARIALFHNEGQQRFTALAAIALPEKLDDAAVLLSGDLDGDGDPDLAVATPDGPPVVLANVTKTPNRWVKVSLKGGKTNRPGIGAKVEVRADRLFASRESDGNPTLIGIGPRGRVDAVRVVWTSGITQDLIDVPAGPVKIEEKREFSGSCPFLYAWDGTTFRFVGEALSGAPVGFLRPDGAYEAPRPTEHLRLPPGLPVARGGRYSLRMTEEMRELSALDGVRLVAVDHRAGVEVYSNERLTEKIEPFAYVAVADPRTPDEAREEGLGSSKLAGGGDGARSDAVAALAALDERAASGFATLGARLEGLAEPHVLDLSFRDVPSAPARLALIVDGWMAWTTSDVSRALLQASGARSGATSAGTSGRPGGSFAGIALPSASSPAPWGPALEMRSSAAGEVLASVPDMGLPIGLSMLVPLPATGRPAGDLLNLRIGTSLAVYYDRIRLGRIVDVPMNVRELEPVSAELRWRGVAAERRARDDEATRPDYDAVSPLSPFPRWEEETTSPGDVLETVDAVDGRLAVFGTGEEVSLEFDATAIPPPAPGMARTWFLVSTGYARDGDPNTQPLPWGPAAR